MVKNMDNIKNKLQQFMIGRYGVDLLGKYNLWSALIILLLSSLLRSNILYVLSILLLILCYYRMFSRNINKRYQENIKFVKFRNKYLSIKGIKKSFSGQKVFKCPECRQKLRTKKRRQVITVTCPKCQKTFKKFIL